MNLRASIAALSLLALVPACNADVEDAGDPGTSEEADTWAPESEAVGKSEDAIAVCYNLADPAPVCMSRAAWRDRAINTCRHYGLSLTSLQMAGNRCGPDSFTKAAARCCGQAT